MHEPGYHSIRVYNELPVHISMLLQSVELFHETHTETIRWIGHETATEIERMVSKIVIVENGAAFDWNDLISNWTGKNQKPATDNADNATDETKVISESDAPKSENVPDTENANGWGHCFSEIRLNM